MKTIILFLLLILSFHPQAQASGPKMFDVHEEINYKDPWFNPKKSDEENFKRIFNALARSEKGKEILSKANHKAAQSGHTLMDVIAVGDGSLTDTTLIRRFSAGDPTKVMYETRSTVYLNRHLKTLDAILDFAHELTHFTYREPFNPYAGHFHLKDFIKSTVEGTGGEVDAFLAECEVLKQLRPGAGFRQSNCQKIYNDETGKISKDLGVEEFYKVGRHFDNLKKDLDKYSINEGDLPKTSSRDAMFISSAYGLPYPVAAVKEYTNIMDRVCKNDQNRLNILQDKLQRAPAQDSSDSSGDFSAANLKTIFEDFRTRCDRFVSK